MLLRLLILLVFTPAVTLSEVVTEEMKDAVSATASAASQATTSGAAESYTVSAFAFVFGICISLVAVAYTYFSILEDALLRKFKREGTTVEGRVLPGDLSFVRHVVPSNSNKGTAEYAAQVQYRFHQQKTCSDGYTSIVRKQIKALDSDFYRASRERQQRRGSNNIVQLHVELSTEDLMESAFSFEQGSDVVFQEHPLSQQYIQLLLLPEHPHSAVPKRQLLRDIQAKRWIPTAWLALVLVLLSCFCVHMGLSNIVALRAAARACEYLLVLALAITVGLLAVDCVLVHWFCYEVFTEALTSEYLEGGEMMVKLDDESLATVSSCLSEEGAWSPRNDIKNPPSVVEDDNKTYGSFVREVPPPVLTASNTPSPAVRSLAQQDHAHNNTYFKSYFARQVSSLSSAPTA